METVRVDVIESEREMETLNSISARIKESIKFIINKNGIRQYYIEIRHVTTHCGNFLAKLFEVDLKDTSNASEKEINLFIKEEVVLEKIKLVNVQEVYAKEIFIYENFAKVANKLQIEANIPECDRFRFASMYEATDDGLIILENLSKQGFKTYHRMDVMPIKYAKLGVAQLAKLHALSFIIENTMPEYFMNHIKCLLGSYNMDDDFLSFIKSSCINVANMCDEKNKKKILDFIPIIQEKLPKYYERKEDQKCCLNHGDYRMNNVLVKEIDGVPSEVIPVDYQLVDYGNPIRDFLFFIFLSTDREFRRKHLNNLKDVYFNTMARFLNYFDFDINFIYPRKEFETDYKECLDYGLMVGIYSIPFIFASDDAGMDLTKKSLSELDIANVDKRCETRVRGLIDDFVEWGML